MCNKRSNYLFVRCIKETVTQFDLHLQDALPKYYISPARSLLPPINPLTILVRTGSNNRPVFGRWVGRRTASRARLLERSFKKGVRSQARRRKEVERERRCRNCWFHQFGFHGQRASQMKRGTETNEGPTSVAFWLWTRRYHN